MTTRTLPLALGTHQAPTRRQALDNLAAAAGSAGQRGPGYTSLNIDLSESYLSQPELCAELVGTAVLLKSAVLDEDSRRHLLALVADVRAQIVALGVDIK